MADPIRILRTPEEHAAHLRRSMDLARFAGISIIVAVDPDNPAAVSCAIGVDPHRAPCYLAVAAELYDLAARFAALHDEQPCARRWA